MCYDWMNPPGACRGGAGDKMPSKCCCCTLLISVILSSRALAVVLYSSPDRNTNIPGSLTNRGTSGGTEGGEDQRRLLNSGWQYQGDFRGFLGTPISSKYFITAKHIGGEFDATNSFVYNGTTYSITTAGNVFDGPAGSDLRIWRINETFPTFAPLYTNQDELGKPLVTFGRGTQRGAEVRQNGVLKGWQWGIDDRVRSWGENNVTGFLDIDDQAADQRLIYFEFNAGAGRNESTLTVGDSGGGVFIQSDGLWKLAGINAGTTTPWHLDESGIPGGQFDAAIFDAGGLWFGANDPKFITDEATDIAGYAIASRISTEMAWIQSVINPSMASVPEPQIGLLISGALGLLWRRPKH